jgi:hypothetical protein
MSSEMEMKMLRALLKDTLAEYKIEEPEKKSYEFQKKYIKRYADALEKAHKKSIGNILINHDKRGSLKKCSAGTIINLDLLEPEIISEIYEFIYYVKKG